MVSYVLWEKMERMVVFMVKAERKRGSALSLHESWWLTDTYNIEVKQWKIGDSFSPGCWKTIYDMIHYSEEIKEDYSACVGTAGGMIAEIWQKSTKSFHKPGARQQKVICKLTSFILHKSKPSKEELTLFLGKQQARYT